MPCVKMTLLSQEFHQQSNSTIIVLSLNMCLCSICCLLFLWSPVFQWYIIDLWPFWIKSRVELVGNQVNNCHLLVTVSFKFEFPQKNLSLRKLNYSATTTCCPTKKNRSKFCLQLGFFQSTYSPCIIFFVLSLKV